MVAVRTSGRWLELVTPRTLRRARRIMDRDGDHAGVPAAAPGVTMSACISRSLITSCLALATARGVLAQPTAGGFDPFPGGTAAQYHFNLERNFFKSPDGEAEARRDLVGRLTELGKLQSGATGSAVDLLRVLRLQDSLLRDVNRHVAYLQLRAAADTRQASAEEAASILGAMADVRFAAVDSLLAALPRATLAGFEQARPELKRYEFAIGNARRRAAHRLDGAGERVLATTAPLATGWGASLFSAAPGVKDFGSVHTAQGDLSVARDLNAIATNPDRAVRREGYLLNQAGLALHRETYAAILVDGAAARNAIARLRGYTDYAGESYGDRYLNRPQVVELLDSVAAAAALNKRVEQLFVEHYRAMFGFDTVHTWDLTLPESGSVTPRFTAAQASRAVVEATKVLGARYTAELSRLLDPANGRLDIAPGPYRASRQGFSTGFVGFPSMFFQGTFGGYLSDVVTLAHESGHAVQDMLLDSSGVLPRYASGPAYFTESLAGLSELLVLRHLYNTAPDQGHKVLYLEQLIRQGAEVFRTGWQSRLEQQLF